MFRLWLQLFLNLRNFTPIFLRTIVVPPTHLDDLFKFIGNTGLNSEKRFLAFQSILYSVPNKIDDTKDDDQ